jgi:hypothetical protein
VKVTVRSANDSTDYFYKTKEYNSLFLIRRMLFYIVLLSDKGMMLNCPLLCTEVSVGTFTLSANYGRIFIAVKYVTHFKDINKM